MTGISYEHPLAFWLGSAAITLGVLLHLPFYFAASDRNYVLAGSSPDAPFMLGMLLIFGGLVATGYGLFPRLSEVSHGYVSRIKVRAMDDAPMKASHVGLLLVMAAAITIDVMKPTTLAFIAPGAALEYGLKGPLNPNADALPIALYPLSGISGTVVGSFVWGWLGDKIGRRASILLAAIIFIAVAVCGAMPEYWMNLVVCFIMGLGVGGMLPITFALMAETIPARHRGWLMVLIGGDVAGAYIITSWLASTIAAPDAFGWRMLWLISLPTGLILILLNRWIPESPRFLLQHGREEEARAIMERYGAVVVEGDESSVNVERDVKSRFATLFSGPFIGLSVVVLLLGIGIGMVQYGFQQWIPSNLQRLGFGEVDASKILRDSALIGFPLNFPIAWLYGFWSAKKTIILMAAATAAALIGFVIAGDSVVDNRTMLYVLLIVPIWGISSLTAVVAAYAAEVYPTRVRSRGTGLAAGATKFGGVMILALVVAAIAAPSISATAVIGAIPIVLAIVAIMIWGVETRKKQLERITAEELHEGGDPVMRSSPSNGITDPPGGRPSRRMIGSA
ncbi:MAG: MFS transporter [Actinobacteria bacterium]|nr:MFS transporter [Actinomycetota bacterium]